MARTRKFIGIEDVLNIFDTSRLWYFIPGFHGYEVSNDGYIRSMKHFRKYPYGIMIKPVAREPYASSSDPLFELSDNDNKRQRIRLSQLMQLAAKNQYAVLGYPRGTIITDGSSRNKYVKNKDGAYVKVYNGPGCRKQLDIPPLDNTAKYAKFTIIQDGTEIPNMSYKQPEYYVPIESINSDEYYGRKDCRVITAEPINDIPHDSYHFYS